MTRRPTAPAAKGFPAVKALPVTALALLAGCSFFSHSITWTKQGATEDQSRSDLAQCQERADVQTARDRNIDQDIAAADPSASAGIDTSPIQNMHAYHDDRRYKSILADCMVELGYRKVE